MLATSVDLGAGRHVRTHLDSNLYAVAKTPSGPSFSVPTKTSEPPSMYTPLGAPRSLDVSTLVYQQPSRSPVITSGG